ncbi:hypothetical protein FHG87_004620 [Trinorchestia longiramus]|nr:hypothetical protein FHG87_004620 [Trinorchestia longiramus]
MSQTWFRGKTSWSRRDTVQSRHEMAWSQSKTKLDGKVQTEDVMNYHSPTRDSCFSQAVMCKVQGAAVANKIQACHVLCHTCQSVPRALLHVSECATCSATRVRVCHVLCYTCQSVSRALLHVSECATCCSLATRHSELHAVAWPFTASFLLTPLLKFHVNAVRIIYATSTASCNSSNSNSSNNSNSSSNNNSSNSNNNSNRSNRNSSNSVR